MIEYSDIKRVARALQKACSEHGWKDNSFRAGELHTYYGAPLALLIGTIMRYEHRSVANEMGLTRSELEYDRGCFVVKAQPCCFVVTGQPCTADVHSRTADRTADPEGKP